MSHGLNGNGNGNGHGKIVLSSQPSGGQKKKQPPPVSTLPAAIAGETRVEFTVDDMPLRGVLIRMTQHFAAFELYSPAVLPRLSAVLEKFQIVAPDGSLYAGRAVVRNVLDAGGKVVCEVILQESSWLDAGQLATLLSGDQVEQDFKQFLKEWRQFYTVMPEFKVIIADMQTFLHDLRLWLDKVEMRRQRIPANRTVEFVQELAAKVQPMIVSGVKNLFERFEEASRRIHPDRMESHQAFAKRQILPLLLCSPFVHRTYHKPRGYAGDYEMVNMMFREPAQGETLYAKMINIYALDLPPIVAHRNRISYLQRQLEQEALRVLRQSKKLSVYSMGCGPAQEVQKYLAQNQLADHTDFTLADMDPETLERTGKLLKELKLRHHRRGSIKPINKSAINQIREFQRVRKYDRSEQHDLIYCAGLFDYLTDETCRQLMDAFYAKLAPGGLLIATNVDDHPARYQMECFLEWNLIQRDLAAMRGITPQQASPQELAIKKEPTGVNIFLEVRKPDREK